MIKPIVVLAMLSLIAVGCAPPPPPLPPPQPFIGAVPPPPPPPPPAMVAPSYSQSYGGPRVGPSMRYGKVKRTKVVCRYNKSHTKKSCYKQGYWYKK